MTKKILQTVTCINHGNPVNGINDENFCSFATFSMENFLNNDGTPSKTGLAVIDIKYLNIKPQAKIRVTIEALEEE